MISPFERGDRRQMLELGVSAKTFRLNCSPIVNLFAQTAEPILLDHTAYEYQVVPDVSAAPRDGGFRDHRSGERQSAIRRSGAVRAVLFLPARRATAPRCRRSGAPRAARRATATTKARKCSCRWSTSPRGRSRPNVDALTVRTVCTNRDLPARLPFGNEDGDFELEGAVPVKRIVALIKPTDALRSAGGQRFHVAAGLAAFAELSVAGGGRQGSVAGDSAALQLHRLHLFRQADRRADCGSTAGGILRA